MGIKIDHQVDGECGGEVKYKWQGVEKERRKITSNQKPKFILVFEKWKLCFHIMSPLTESES